jgi:branched-chain amino acid transport system ATP-binding protein
VSAVPDGSGNGRAQVLVVDDIHTFYGSIEALKGISIEVNEGEIVTLIGANGAGKSTTLRSISGIVPPRTGRILFNGREIQGLPGHTVAEIGIAQSPEGRRIFPRMTVLENLEMGAFTRRDPAGIREDLDRVYTLFPRLKERERQKGGTMSGGEQQMLAIGRALMAQPKLLLLDEPFAGVGSGEIADLSALIRQVHAQEGLTVVLIEHKLREFMRLVGRVIALDFGEVIARGLPEDIVKHPAVIEAYIGQDATEAEAGHAA